MLQYQQAHHPAYRLGRAAVVGAIEALEGFLENIPVYLVGQKVQRVLLVKLGLQVEEQRLLGCAVGFRVHRFASFSVQRYDFLVNYTSILTTYFINNQIVDTF